MRTNWTGVGTALVTPFTRTGELDEPAVRRLGRRQIDAGVHFLVPCGTTGENPTLTDAERIRIVEILVDESNGRVPILAGAGGYNTREIVALAGEMLKAGASGLLSVTPYYNKPTQEGLFQHYRAIADSTPLPIVLYNVPGRTGCNLEPATVARLAAIPNIVGVKEASGNILQMCDICRLVPQEFLVIAGDDMVTLPLMAVGGRGVISVASNEVPAEMVKMVETAERGDFAAARTMHVRLLPLMQVNFVEANPVPIKAAMSAMGLLEEVYRLPMCSPKAESKEKILAVLKSLDLIPALPDSASPNSVEPSSVARGFQPRVGGPERAAPRMLRPMAAGASIAEGATARAAPQRPGLEGSP
jgi:4-hydroxy-tetrahydrodipicolinate synthase